MTSKNKTDLLNEIDRLATEYKLDDYLYPYFTKRGNLVFYDLEEKRTLRNSQGKLLHNKLAIEWLENEAIDGEDLGYLYKLLN
jgi:hypothetical protein